MQINLLIKRLSKALKVLLGRDTTIVIDNNSGKTHRNTVITMGDDSHLTLTITAPPTDDS